MMDKLRKLMEKKRAEGSSMSPLEQKSKMSMLDSLRGEMDGLMKEDLANGKGMKKVEVASPDSEGLKLGLHKAQDLLDKDAGPNEGDEGDNAEPSEDHDGIESDEQEQSEDNADEMIGSDDEGKEHMDAYHTSPSKENLDNLMAHLERKKAMMK